jgi:hypothetical protein
MITRAPGWSVFKSGLAPDTPRAGAGFWSAAAVAISTLTLPLPKSCILALSPKI